MMNPDRDGKILVGRGASDENLSLALVNRHGLCTGASPGVAAVGLFKRTAQWFSNVFGIGRPHRQVLTTSPVVARNAARAVVTGFATQVAAKLAKSAARPQVQSARPFARAAPGGVMRR